MENRIYIPLIPWDIVYTLEGEGDGCYSSFWGFDARRNKDGNLCEGFFFDIRTYDEKYETTLYCPPRVEYICWTDEHARMLEGHLCRKKQPYLPYAFVYRIENSEVLERFYKGSEGIFNNIDNPLFHYQFLTYDDVVDIISTSEPILFQK